MSIHTKLLLSLKSKNEISTESSDGLYYALKMPQSLTTENRLGEIFLPGATAIDSNYGGEKDLRGNLNTKYLNTLMK